MFHELKDKKNLFSAIFVCKKKEPLDHNDATSKTCAVKLGLALSNIVFYVLTRSYFDENIMAYILYPMPGYTKNDKPLACKSLEF